MSEIPRRHCRELRANHKNNNLNIIDVDDFAYRHSVRRVKRCQKYRSSNRRPAERGAQICEKTGKYTRRPSYIIHHNSAHCI